VSQRPSNADNAKAVAKYLGDFYLALMEEGVFTPETATAVLAAATPIVMEYGMEGILSE